MIQIIPAIVEVSFAMGVWELETDHRLGTSQLQVQIIYITASFELIAELGLSVVMISRFY